MSPATTLAPSRTKTLTDAFPIPDPAPVITATLPSRRPIGVASAGEDGERLPASHRRRGCELSAVAVDVPLGKTLQYLLERDATFEASQGGAEAEVGPVAEGEMLLDLPVDVEVIAVREATVV